MSIIVKSTSIEMVLEMRRNSSEAITFREAAYTHDKVSLQGYPDFIFTVMSYQVIGNRVQVIARGHTHDKEQQQKAEPALQQN